MAERLIAAGQFKARCLKLIDEVAESGTPLVVTKRGRPVVKLVPADELQQTLFGAMAGTAAILGDIVGPFHAEWRGSTGVRRRGRKRGS